MVVEDPSAGVQTRLYMADFRVFRPGAAIVTPVDSPGGIRYVPPPVRRGARVADRGGLENRCTFAGTVGSNPTLSAINAEAPTGASALMVLGWSG